MNLMLLTQDTQDSAGLRSNPTALCFTYTNFVSEKSCVFFYVSLVWGKAPNIKSLMSSGCHR